MRSTLRAAVLVLGYGVLLLSAPVMAADRQVRPFVGATFAGATTVVDPEDAITKARPVIGGTAVFLGEIFGVDIDVSDVPGFFGPGDRNLVNSSRVTTLTGNIVIAAPHRLTEYSLRPYLVAGAGMMRLRTTTLFDVFNVSESLPAFDVGVGAVGFMTKSLGVSWELRRFQDLGRNVSDVPGLSFGDEQHLSFWRATMAFVVRY